MAAPQPRQPRQQQRVLQGAAAHEQQADQGQPLPWGQLAAVQREGRLEEYMGPHSLGAEAAPVLGSPETPNGMRRNAAHRTPEQEDEHRRRMNDLSKRMTSNAPSEGDQLRQQRIQQREQQRLKQEQQQQQQQQLHRGNSGTPRGGGANGSRLQTPSPGSSTGPSPSTGGSRSGRRKNRRRSTPREARAQRLQQAQQSGKYTPGGGHTPPGARSELQEQVYSQMAEDMARAYPEYTQPSPADSEMLRMNREAAQRKREKRRTRISTASVGACCSTFDLLLDSVTGLFALGFDDEDESSTERRGGGGGGGSAARRGTAHPLGGARTDKAGRTVVGTVPRANGSPGAPARPGGATPAARRRNKSPVGERGRGPGQVYQNNANHRVSSGPAATSGPGPRAALEVPSASATYSEAVAGNGTHQYDEYAHQYEQQAEEEHYAEEVGAQAHMGMGMSWENSHTGTADLSGAAPPVEHEAHPPPAPHEEYYEPYAPDAGATHHYGSDEMIGGPGYDDHYNQVGATHALNGAAAGPGAAAAAAAAAAAGGGHVGEYVDMPASSRSSFS